MRARHNFSPKSTNEINVTVDVHGDASLIDNWNFEIDIRHSAFVNVGTDGLISLFEVIQQIDKAVNFLTAPLP
ncbi:hypothetical protein AB4254_09400, partial [Vibrio breoganii]